MWGIWCPKLLAKLHTDTMYTERHGEAGDMIRKAKGMAWLDILAIAAPARHESVLKNRNFPLRSQCPI